MSTNKTKSGFTLVEILIISPLVILLIAGIISAIVGITGKSLAVRSHGVMIDEVQSSLNTMEFDINKAVEFPYSVPQSNVPSPLSLSNNSAAIITSRTGTLIVRAPSTTQNPLFDSRGLVYKNDPNSGGCSGDITDNDFHSVYYVFFLDTAAKKLWRRTIKEIPETNCNTAWQKNSCREGFANGTTCIVEDEPLANDVQSFSIAYYRGGNTTPVPTTWTESDQPTAVVISVTATKEVAGKPLSVSSSIRLTSVNL